MESIALLVILLISLLICLSFYTYLLFSFPFSTILLTIISGLVVYIVDANRNKDEF